METKLKSSVGNVVTGERFWDRETDRKLFIERIDGRANILLVAQRRMGKTSLLKKIAEELKEHYYPIFVDLQAARNSPDAIRDLSVAIHEHKALGQKIKEVISNILNKIEKLDVFEFGVTLRAGLSASNWEQKGDEIFKALAQADKPVLLLLDEVPIMLSYMLKGKDSKITASEKIEVDKFMSWLRKNSLAHQANVRVVISGSIGLEPILKQAGLSATINHLEPFELKPWSEPVAIACIEALSNEYKVELHKGVAKEMVNKIGCCIPHHIQMFFNHIYTWCVRKGNMVCSIKDVDEVYQNEMLGVRGHAEWSHYEE
ncbi:MAG: ATP-binding protein, partial [Sedimentisphaerales bacterium]